MNRRHTDSAPPGVGPTPDPQAPCFSLRPEQILKLAPCQTGCPNSGDIRGWLGVIAQRDKLGITLEDAYDRAWLMIARLNPLPATLGRICPHPCEDACTRSDKDGAVSIHEMERFLGDWALSRALRLPTTDDAAPREPVGVIGSGPAGLSFAYQMARRGYEVTVYDDHDLPGGMLRHGIPDFRLPPEVLDGEIQRLWDLGIRWQPGVRIDAELGIDELRRRHRVLFLGMGAQRARQLDIPGTVGPGVWSGIEYLQRLNAGETIDLGRNVAVVGGGNTAIDAARMARRSGADVTLLYRRTRSEMPAITSEVDEALAESIRVEFLATPVRINRDFGRIKTLVYQRMRLAEPDDSGRRRPVPVPDEFHELAIDAVIEAVSQETDLAGFAGLPSSRGWLEAGRVGRLSDGVWAGGDDLGLGIASLAVSQGRHAAEAAHAELRDLKIGEAPARQTDARPYVKTPFYPERPPVETPRVPAEGRLSEPDREVSETISSADARREASRCLSCGACFGCQQCWMYCNAGGLVRLEEVEPGSYFAFISDVCEGCGKCIELCPSGFLSEAPP